jgi:hypothetical protein
MVQLRIGALQHEAHFRDIPIDVKRFLCNAQIGETLVKQEFKYGIRSGRA